VVALLLNLTASGQSFSHRGKLTLLPDGYAKVKIADLRYVAAYRVMANDHRLNAVLEISSLRRTITLKDDELKEVLEREALKAERVRAIAERNATLEDSLTKCATKRDKLKPWSDVGKVAVGALALVAGYTIYTNTLAP
jgi:hypothetical protein